MAKAALLTATLPDGTVATRRTARTYSHVVATRTTYTDGSGGRWNIHGWCGRPDLAQKQAAQLAGRLIPGKEVPVSWSAEGGWTYKTVATYEVQAAPVGV